MMAAAGAAALAGSVPAQGGRTTADAGRRSITQVPGLKVGHYTDTRRPTGCTVIIAEAGATAGVDDARRGARHAQNDLLNPSNMVEKVHAVMLAGGSAFGLDAAGGVMRYLEERKIGFDVGVAHVPIVPAAILFDLGVGDASVRPDAAAGYQACKSASAGPVQEGNVGAGAGARWASCTVRSAL